MKLGKHATLFTFIALASFLALASLPLSCAKPPVPKAECEGDNDCPDGKVCQGGKCITKVVAPPPPECVSASDCPNNKICKNGKCVLECQGPDDCGPGQECVNNRCQAKPECSVSTVRFDFNEYFLTGEAQSVLRANADCLKQKKVTRVIIEGHCDERGSVQYNLSLGQKRAQAVRDFLADLGIDKNGIKVVSYGEERPIDSGHDEAAWGKNRRGETVIEK